jgi:hypothetical protein
MSRDRRGLWFAIGVILIVAAGLGGFVLGRNFTYNDVSASRDLIDQLQLKNQSLNQQILGQNTKITTLQTNLASVQAALNAITPSRDAYNIDPNQSVVVANGRLTVGLVGSPSNEGVTINVNGKEQFVAAGGIIKVTPDPSTTCQVIVQSFDMFHAVVNASCAAAKPQ